MANFTAGDAINLATGTYSLVRGLTRRRPGSFQPVAYTPVVTPATGDPEGLERQRNAIADNAAAATRDVTTIAGSDANAGLNARLGIQRNANQASAEAEAANQAIVRDQQRQNAQIQNQAAYANAQTQNQARAVNYEQEVASYNQAAAAAGAGLSSSLNYITQREANLRNNQIQQETAANQAAQQIDAVQGSLYQDAYVRATVDGKSPEEAKKIAMESIQGFKNGFVPKTRKLS